MSATTLKTHLEDGVATVTLARPEASNAVNEALRSDFIRALRSLNEDAQVAAIVLTGAGRSFCAGQDLREAAAMTAAGVPAWQAQQRAMYQSLRDLDKPCVAALNGAAAGAGFQVALCADLRVAHAGVRLGQPEVKAGIASIVGSWMMTLHLGLSKNIALSLGGELIDAQEAHALGLVHHLVAPEDVLPTAHRLARALAAQPPVAFRLTKQRFREMTQAGFDEACAAGARLQAACYAAGEPQRVLAERLAGKK
ncbi:MAG TPA: enoyl-CoA hydratase/isomerase family protein [Ramlibacter sp.]|uniref:enoyl-CoA hydratase/isomerase family protein n=1 Tax=Ramlibacter sp. TaxID=1917967 RepID=UPI002D801CCD|nr:enoyl-CoA hydratase/isomerase family protein [Ramlibacter sp.]HET8747292.1 enoyl-CoA hydratase/isomerase family protein [Ramlibacter sp.]